MESFLERLRLQECIFIVAILSTFVVLASFVSRRTWVSAELFWSLMFAIAFIGFPQHTLGLQVWYKALILNSYDYCRGSVVRACVLWSVASEGSGSSCRYVAQYNANTILGFFSTSGFNRTSKPFIKYVTLLADGVRPMLGLRAWVAHFAGSAPLSRINMAPPKKFSCPPGSIPWAS